MADTQVPVALSIAGHDPSGGAGLQADIEALDAMGCHAVTALTCVTIQDTSRMHRLVPIEARLVREQAEAILADMPVAAIKIGVLASVDIVHAIHALLIQYPHLPVVLDPVLAAGGDNAALAGDDTLSALRELLLPLATVLTPNGPEALRLAAAGDDPDDWATALQARGCHYVLITGGHEPGAEVVNRLYSDGALLESYHWPRLPGRYHGSGCTLASAIAGLLAQGFEMRAAVQQAQQYTWATLQHGFAAGRGQQLPDRLFKTRGNWR